MSEPKRIHHKTERTPEELAELRAERERFSRTRPGPGDLTASSDYDGPYRQGDLMALLSALATLRQERERQGLSLAEVSDRSGLDKGMLSRLENGKILNPTVATLWRYADAVGMSLKLSAEKAPLGAG
jgi:ribosome-binding protein aMBF1 (putative translation factor)